MRTTINLDEQLLAQAKLLAHQTGKTFSAIVDEALRERLARRTVSAKGEETFRLHTFTGKGMQPGVDLDNSAALRDLMDDPS
jgi:hypothetical protein